MELVRRQEQSAGTRHKSRHHGGEVEYRIYCIVLSIRSGHFQDEKKVPSLSIVKGYVIPLTPGFLQLV